MRKFTSKFADMIVSEDNAKRFLVLGEGFLNDKIVQLIETFFLNKPEYREYCSLWAKIKKVKPYAILNAHGLDREKGKYCDGNRVYSIQNWINYREGQYGTLLIGCCNPMQWIPSSRRSLIMFSNGDTKYSISTRGSRDKHFNFELLHPKKGIIDSYCIEAELAELKKQALERS